MIGMLRVPAQAHTRQAAVLHAMATQTERSPLATARRAADVGCGSHHTIISAQWLIKSLEHGSNTPPRRPRLVRVVLVVARVFSVLLLATWRCLFLSRERCVTAFVKRQHVCVRTPLSSLSVHALQVDHSAAAGAAPED